MLNEFKEFAMRGNVVDMAVGIILGVAFGGIVKSLVVDVVMPPIGLVLGGVDFSDIFINLSGGEHESLMAAKEAGAATINVGVFINAVLHFLIVAFAIFLLVRAMNKLKREEETTVEPQPTTKLCPHCLSSIPLKATRCAYCVSELESAGAGGSG